MPESDSGGTLAPRVRRLPPALLGVLAALLLAGLTPTQASVAEASDEAGGGETITTVLHPGWNMVGWVGSRTPTSELFEEIQALRRVSSWDAGEGAHLRAFRGDYAQLPSLTPGIGLWLHLGGNATVEWTRPGRSDGVVTRLQAGLNLVGVVADGAVNPPDHAEARAWRWDPARQGYEPYRFGDATLSGGEALWIEAAAPLNLWQPGNAMPPFVLLDDIPVDCRQLILMEYRSMRRFFAERFGAATRGRLHYIAASVDTVRAVHPSLVGSQDQEGVIGWNSGIARIRIWQCARPAAGVLGYNYVSQLLVDIPRKSLPWRGAPTLDPRGPGWLIAGVQRYAFLSYREAAIGPEVQQRQNLDAAAKRVSWPLSYFEVTESRDGATNYSESALGFLAVEWLAERAGNSSVFDYFKLMRTSEDWRAAFATAFRIDVDDFYEQFEASRTETLPPLPHLTDDLEEPALLFVGDIPAARVAAIRTEFGEVRPFFADRFEAEATEFTLYVVADSDAARSAFPELRSVSCTLRPFHGRVIAPLDRCGPSLPLDQIYVSAMVAELAPLGQLNFTGIGVYTDSTRGPNWLIAGLEDYARSAYRAAARGWDLADTWAWYARVARITGYSLRDVATSGDGPVGALGYLAVDWLVERAGEPAVFEYYRLLPPLPSVDAAFEQAFGLTLEDFYDEFDEYHARLRQ